MPGHGVFHWREDVCLHHAPLQLDAVQVVYLAHVTHLLNDDVVLVAYLLHTKRRREHLIGRYKSKIKTTCADRFLRLYNLSLLIVNSTLICDQVTLVRVPKRQCECCPGQLSPRNQFICFRLKIRVALTVRQQFGGYLCFCVIVHLRGAWLNHHVVVNRLEIGVSRLHQRSNSIVHPTLIVRLGYVLLIINPARCNVDVTVLMTG